MRVDAYTHFFPRRFFAKLMEIAGDYKDMGKRVQLIPVLHDLDQRKKLVDGFKDYQQILSYPQPPIETFAKSPAQIDELIRMLNDGFAELCAAERDHFPGWVAQISLDAPDAGVAEAERAINQLGALGVQIYTNVAGKPIDRPQYLPFWKKMNELGKPIWLHPARGANMPDYIDEKKSLYEIWWTFGWSYETACAMGRLVFSKIMDNHPNLKIITHHFAGIVPMLEGRIGPGWDVIGERTSDEDYVSLRKSLKKRPLDYFKQDFYADTAVFGGVPATKCGLEFFPHDKIIFASDCPFDPERGTMYPRLTLQILDSLDLPKDLRAKIDYKNLEAVTGRKLVT
ncbi:MAG TPA: amidohydrolase family protein [Xanthobacteraceae bacterium]|jgi:aminocarboxymuconate-semialdehyde decarboxylase|nr:amidohydrolase family protein [Xanthobacteraceae bacterium]